MNPSDDDHSGAEMLPPGRGEGAELGAHGVLGTSPPLYPLSPAQLVRRLYGKELCRALEAHAELAAWMLPGDEIWRWRSGSFLTLSGKAGYAIRRKGQVFASWLVIMN